MDLYLQNMINHVSVETRYGMKDKYEDNTLFEMIDTNIRQIASVETHRFMNRYIKTDYKQPEDFVYYDDSNNKITHKFHMFAHKNDLPVFKIIFRIHENNLKLLYQTISCVFKRIMERVAHDKQAYVITIGAETIDLNSVVLDYETNKIQFQLRVHITYTVYLQSLNIDINRRHDFGASTVENVSNMVYKPQSCLFMLLYNNIDEYMDDMWYIRDIDLFNHNKRQRIE